MAKELENKSTGPKGLMGSPWLVLVRTSQCPLDLTRTKDAGTLGSRSELPLTIGALYITLWPQFPPLGGGENRSESQMIRMQCEQGARINPSFPYPTVTGDKSCTCLVGKRLLPPWKASKPLPPLTINLQGWAAGRIGDLAMWPWPLICTTSPDQPVPSHLSPISPSSFRMLASCHVTLTGMLLDSQM